MISAAEVEIISTYVNVQEDILISTSQIEADHPQPPTPIQVDNSTEVGFSNKSIKQKISKSIFV